VIQSRRLVWGAHAARVRIPAARRNCCNSANEEMRNKALGEPPKAAREPRALPLAKRSSCRLKGDFCVAEGNALGTHSIKFPAPKGVFNRESVLWFEVPRRGTWICGSTSGGAAPGYEDSGLQPARALKFFNYRTDPFPGFPSNGVLI